MFYVAPATRCHLGSFGSKMTVRCSRGARARLRSVRARQPAQPRGAGQYGCMQTEEADGDGGSSAMLGGLEVEAAARQAIEVEEGVPGEAQQQVGAEMLQAAAPEGDAKR
eukprot:COSAG02_NODE_4181_length_5656_cov_2.900846_7_plen_110_part_00